MLSYWIAKAKQRWQEAMLRQEIAAIEHNRRYLCEVLNSGPAELKATERALQKAMQALAVLTDKALPAVPEQKAQP